MVDDDRVSVAVSPACEDHNSGRGGGDGGSHAGVEVDAGMKALDPKDRVNAVAEG